MVPNIVFKSVLCEAQPSYPTYMCCQYCTNYTKYSNCKQSTSNLFICVHCICIVCFTVYVLVNMPLISVIFRFKAVVMDESQGSAEQVGAYTT